MARRLALLLLSALALGAQTAPVGDSERLGTKGINSASNISSSQAKLSLTRRLRDQMLKWYCAQPGNDALSPCKLMDLRAISDPAAKKEKMSALVQMIKSKTKEAQQAEIKAERETYISMYRAYCAQEEQKSSEACTNAVLKKLYRVEKR